MFEGVIQMPTLEFKGRNVPWLSNSDSFFQITNYIKAPVASIYYMNPSAGPGHYTGADPDLYNNPINVAARKMYAELSASNAKTSAYAPQDIATLILAIGQAIALITHAKRIYKIANYFNFYNRVIPKTLIEGCFISYDGEQGLKQNLANYRAKVNQQIAKLNTIKFPGNLNYFKKCGYIYDHVFLDRTDEMPTYQMMAPCSTWILDEAGFTEGSVLKTVDMMPNEPQTWFWLTEVIDSVLEQILTSSTFNYVFADVINLANRGVITSPSVTLDMLGIDEFVMPEYDPRFNWQVRNMSIIGTPNGSDLTQNWTPSNDVYHSVDQSAIRYAPVFGFSSTSSTLVDNLGLAQPVRLPDVAISHKDFASLLTYYNSATLSQYENNYGAIFYSITDYYCCKQRVFIGDGTTTHMLTSNKLPTTGTVGLSALMIENAPTYFAGTPRTNTGAFVLSDLGAYTQIPGNALENLRFQNFLGLFKFE